jgi:hypothetical protein
LNEPETTTVVAGDASATVAEAAKKLKARRAPKWETDARDRLKTAIRRYSKPLADLVARDANEGDTRLLVTDFLYDGLGLTSTPTSSPSARSRASSPTTGCASIASWWPSSSPTGPLLPPRFR